MSMIYDAWPKVGCMTVNGEDLLTTNSILAVMADRVCRCLTEAGESFNDSFKAPELKPGYHDWMPVAGAARIFAARAFEEAVLMSDKVEVSIWHAGQLFYKDVERICEEYGWSYQEFGNCGFLIRRGK